MESNRNMELTGISNNNSKSHISEEIKIYVNSKQKYIDKFKLRLSQSVLDLKVEIEKITGIPADQIILHQHEERMENEKPLSYYHIKEGDSVNFTVKQRGGVEVVVRIDKGAQIKLDLFPQDTI
jgi:hypothetical protein